MAGRTDSGDQPVEATPGQRRSAGDAEAPARKRLIAATVDVLRTMGSDGVTSRAIADEAGENLGSITYYFGSKDTLVHEAMISVAEELIGPVIAEMAKPGINPATALVVGIQRLHAVLAENRQQLPAYLHSLAAASTSAPLAESMVQLHQSLTGSLATLIEDYRAEGETPDWVDPEAMAQLVTAVVHGVALGVAIEDAAGEQETDPSTVAAQFGQLLLGVRPTT